MAGAPKACCPRGRSVYYQRTQSLMGYINPLLHLQAANALVAMPIDQRELLQMLLRLGRQQADCRAEAAWARGLGEVAAVWRAVATYARHLAHALGAGLRRRPGTQLTVEPAVVHSMDYRICLLTRLPAGRALLKLPSEMRAPVVAVLNELAQQARRDANTAWKRRKGPMASYWLSVAAHTQHCAQLLGMGNTQGNRQAQT